MPAWLLRSALGRLSDLSVVASAPRLVGGPDLLPFYDDRFDSISGSFEIARGVVETRDLRIRYPGYDVDLWGELDLSDLGLDMQGRITLGGKLAGLVFGKDDEDSDRSDAIPLARIGGSLHHPVVQLTPETLTRLALGLGLGLPRKLVGGAEGAVGALRDLVGGR